MTHFSNLYERLTRPESYPHAVEQVEVRQTHISWVFLTGEFAYKLKKPVDLGFVDFSTLESRRKYCHEEVRRNRLYSQDVYMDVLPVVEIDGGVQVGGQGPAIDYVVQMHQFDDSQLADILANSQQLTAKELAELAIRVAEYHRQARQANQEPWGTPSNVLESALENVHVLRRLTSHPEHLEALSRVEHWTRKTHQSVTEVMRVRRQEGMIRECHGDLHLGNIVRWNHRLTPFDCIEFNPDFYWIDVLSEVAFLLMDLDAHQCSELGWQFLNSYLEQTGDYVGLAVMPFYKVYRAMVRAKICDLRLQQSGIESADRKLLDHHWVNYLNLATDYLNPPHPFLAITHGLSGSGKTHGSESLMKRTGAIRIRSDVERKRRDRPSTLTVHSERQAECSPGDAYAASEIRKVYERLSELARSTIAAGYSVIVDATFLKRDQRTLFRNLADQLGLPFHLLEFRAAEDTLRDRIRQRRGLGQDASEATEEVLDLQLREIEPLDAFEQRYSIEMEFFLNKYGMGNSPKNAP